MDLLYIEESDQCFDHALRIAGLGQLIESVAQLVEESGQRAQSIGIRLAIHRSRSRSGNGSQKISVGRPRDEVGSSH